MNAENLADTVTAQCPFCQIARGEGDAELYADTGSVLVFEPLNPVTPGHLLVVPTRHVVDFAESPATSALVMDEAARFARSHSEYDQANVITSRGSAATQTVKHLHVHLVPRRPDDGLPLPWTNQLLADPADRDERTESIAERSLSNDWRDMANMLHARARRAEAEVARQHKIICRLERTVEGYEKYPVDGAEVIAKENAELRATVDRVRALADKYRKFSGFNITARDADKQLRAALDGAGEQQ